MERYRPTGQGMPIHIPGQTPPKDDAEPDTATSVGDRFERLSLSPGLPRSYDADHGGSGDDSDADSNPGKHTDNGSAQVMDTSLQLDELNNGESRKLIAAIDQLRDLGVNEDLSLPQLVVVGDQSSGKSSLLEGLTGLAFPIASDICTRFVTHFTTRHTQEPLLRVSIKPGPKSKHSQRSLQRLAAFEKVLDSDALGDRLEMEAMFKEVAELMGLSMDVGSSPSRRDKHFSDDILSIEFSGPEHNDISIIDLPGLFHTATRFQTGVESHLIRETIIDYIRNEDTIILAVMNANNNLANQAVFDLARDKDPQGLRTIGVMTKCDTVQAGDEQSVMKVAQNEVKRLHHGWFVVRNRSTREIEEGVSIQRRHELEKDFFSTRPWSLLDRSRCGVKALTTYLAVILSMHIKKQMPRISGALEQLQGEAVSKLRDMGEVRQTPSEQRQYLMRFAQSYERLLNESLDGHHRSDVGESSALRLRRSLQALKKSFRAQMYARGHTWAFMNLDNTLDTSYTVDDRIGTTATAMDELPGLDTSAIYQWIWRNYENSSSMELPGTVDAKLVQALFHQQTQHWVGIAEEYLADIGVVLRRYIIEAHETLVPDAYGRAILLKKHKEHLDETLSVASAELSKLLADERESSLSTANTAFTQRISADRSERTLARLRALGMPDNVTPEAITQVRMIETRLLMNAVRPRWQEQIVYDIHDILKAFYEVVRERFMDSIWMAAVKRNLTREASAMMLLKSDYILALGDQELAELASEHPELAKRRTELQQKCARYNDAMMVIGALREG